MKRKTSVDPGIDTLLQRMRGLRIPQDVDSEMDAKLAEFRARLRSGGPGTHKRSLRTGVKVAPERNKEAQQVVRHYTYNPHQVVEPRITRGSLFFVPHRGTR